MVVIAPGWQLEVERGPDWLIVTLSGDVDAERHCPPLAQAVWDLAEQHFTYRVVVDLARIHLLHTALIGQLVRLQKRLCMHDGVLRLCGLSEVNYNVLHSCRLDGYFPLFHERSEAVRGSAVPAKPR